MKNLSKNSSAWLVLTALIGWLFIENGRADEFLVIVSALIVAKQIEILNKQEK